MNILILHSWLKDFLKTKATPQKIAECLSLCGPSVEKLEKVNEDWLYEIEVTTNRPDCFGVMGVAREAAAILPRFDIKAQFIYSKPKRPKTPRKELPLEIKNEPKLCRRVLGVVLNQVKIKTSPKFISQRLEAAGVRSLNNLIDITNYVMLEVGHPTHAFDYDRIKTHRLIIRPAKKGEKIVSLENKTYFLPGGDTVIDDGSGQIIDLPGIIGTQNSVVVPETKRILFFIENNDPAQIKRTSMALNIRTQAAIFNEKGPDPNLAMLALLRGIELYEKFADAKLASKIFDIYPQPYQPKEIQISMQKIKEQLRVDIPKREVVQILESLGFKILSYGPEVLKILVPSWRADDVSIPQDLIEEIARIFGYHQLPVFLPTGEFPEPTFEKTFYYEEKIKDSRKNWGFTEVYTYSMQSKDLIEKTGLKLKKCLKIKNPLTRELEYMRTSLIPSILKLIADNQENCEVIKIFELANIFLPQKNKLPEEKPILIGAITGEEKFYEAKGVVEALLEELGIKNFQFSIFNFQFPLWHPSRTAQITKGKELLGVLGEIHPKVLANFGIEKRVVVFNLDAVLLFKLAEIAKTYVPIPKYPAIIEDLCFIVKSKTQIGNLIRLIEQTSSIIQTAHLIDIFNNQRTIRIVYQHSRRTLRDEEVKKIREKMAKIVEKKLGAKLKVLE